MKVNVISLDSKKAEDITLNKNVFGLEVRKDVLQRVVEWQRANVQAGTHKTKERGEIQGTTKKPFRQKGTGNARQGSLKGPHQRSGGVAHGPRVRSHSYKLTKKFRQLGLKTALSLKASENKLHILSTTSITDPKTKALAASLSKAGITNALVIDGQQVNEIFAKAARNIKRIDVLPQQGANVYDILNHENLVLTVDAVKQLEERLA